MAEARCREAWAYTASRMALVANCHRDPRKRPTPYKPADFHPYLRQPEPPARKASIEVLKQVFVERS